MSNPHWASNIIKKWELVRIKPIKPLLKLRISWKELEDNVNIDRIKEVNIQAVFLLLNWQEKF